MAENVPHKIVDVSVAIIVNDRNEVLLQKKNMGYPWFPGGWCLFGGGKERDETPEETIRREMGEELPAVSCDGLRLFKKDSYRDVLPNRTRGGERHCFVVNYRGNISELSVREGAGFAYFSAAELDSIPLVQHDKDLLREFYESYRR